MTLSILFLLFFLLLFLLFLLLFLLNLGRGVGAALLLVLGGVRVAGLLARSLAEPLRQLGCKEKLTEMSSKLVSGLTCLQRPTETLISAICRNQIFCTFKKPNILPKPNVLKNT